jgi:hypothetical protein
MEGAIMAGGDMVAVSLLEGRDEEEDGDGEKIEGDIG